VLDLPSLSEPGDSGGEPNAASIARLNRAFDEPCAVTALPVGAGRLRQLTALAL
jgi:hypothetical protein